MSDKATVRRAATYVVICTFSIAALMGIVALLGGGTFGEGEGRVLVTTLIVGCASVCTLCYVATAGTRWSAVGATGGVVLIVPVASSLVLVWGNVGSDEALGRTFGIGLVLSATLAQICLMLVLATRGNVLPGILYATIGLAVLLAVLVVGLIVGALSGEAVWRPLGVVAILDALGTVVTIAIAKFGAAERAERSSGSSAQLQVSLSTAQSDALARLAATTGREPATLVAEAVDRYLAG